MQKRGKQLLAELERDGNHVFHGSARKIDVFEPRQAANLVKGEFTPDDKPGIHASALIDIAIFMAIINDDNCAQQIHGGYGYYGNCNLVFEVTKQAFEQLKNPSGYVYVFNRNNFTKRNEIEYICYHPIQPIGRVEVGIHDMPPGIKLTT